MKRFIQFSVVITFSAISFFSCRKPTEEPSLADIMKRGIWHVNLMKAYGSDYTSYYSDWKFTFKTDTTLIVSNGVDSCAGMWKEDKNRRKFILNIQTNDIELIMISREWDIDLKNPGRVQFLDDRFSPHMDLQLSKF